MFECIGKWRTTCKWIVIYSRHRPSAESLLFICRHSAFLAIENSRFMNMCYMWMFACDKNRTVLFVRSAEKKARTWIEHVNFSAYSIQWKTIIYPMKFRVFDCVFNYLLVFRWHFSELTICVRPLLWNYKWGKKTDTSKCVCLAKHWVWCAAFS